LRKRGHEVLITARNFTETISLADRCGLDYIPVGAHGGKTMIGKAMALFQRAIRLALLARSQHVSFATSSSFSQALAAPLARLPLVIIGDYEGQPGHYIICRVARRLIVPNSFDKSHLLRYGAKESQIVSYSGIKEQVYLASFTPDPAFRERLGIPDNAILVTMRPPSEVSAYHRFKNTVFDDTVRYIARHDNTVAVLLPRGAEQREYYTGFRLPNVVIPKEVLDGPQLVYWSDLIVGAGGTMNREATVFNTPVYTQFQGMPGSVDQNLIAQEKMCRVVDIADIASIKVCKKQPVDGEPWKQGARLVNEVVDLILF
jgi:uncharacterized protein